MRVSPVSSLLQHRLLDGLRKRPVYLHQAATQAWKFVYLCFQCSQSRNMAAEGNMMAGVI